MGTRRRSASSERDKPQQKTQISFSPVVFSCQILPRPPLIFPSNIFLYRIPNINILPAYVGRLLLYIGGLLYSSIPSTWAGSSGVITRPSYIERPVHYFCLPTAVLSFCFLSPPPPPLAPAVGTVLGSFLWTCRAFLNMAREVSGGYSFSGIVLHINWDNCFLLVDVDDVRLLGICQSRRSCYLPVAIVATNVNHVSGIIQKQE